MPMVPSVPSADSPVFPQVSSALQPDMVPPTLSQPLDDGVGLLERIIGTRVPVLKFIPKASRIWAARKLASLLDSIVSVPDNLELWSRLLLFTYSCLGKPERGGKKRRSSLASSVNKALSDFPEGLSSQPVKQAEIKRRNRPKASDNVWSLAARVSAKIEEGDVRGAIRMAASDDTLAPFDEVSLEALRRLHPRRAAPAHPEPSAQATNTTEHNAIPTEGDIVEAIKSFPAGSAGGLDGMRPQHLKDMTTTFTGPDGKQLISSLTRFVGLCLTGQVPLPVRPVFFGASLTALAKKGGGVRPIAVGSTIRRLVAKVACSMVRRQVVDKLVPHQLGFGVKLGAEAAVHSTRSYLRSLNEGQALMKIDFSNAFNTLSRTEMLNVVQAEVPSLFEFISSCYSDFSFLRFGQYTLSSEEGPQQGDPLGPLLFCLTVMPLVQRVQSPFNIWYMDDGTLGGDADTLISDFRMLKTEGEKLGLVINPAKCELITDDISLVDRVRVVIPDILHTNKTSAELMGAPVGGEEGIGRTLETKLKALRCLADRLSFLSAHDALFLLKNCFAIPKLTYTLRSAPCYRSQLLSEFDLLIRSTLESILNIAMSDEAWDQATLPVAKGGIGVRKASDIALPAFVSSVVGAQELLTQLLPMSMHTTSGVNESAFLEALDEWNSRTGNSPLHEISSSAQSWWDAPLVRAQESKVLKAARDQSSKARLIAASAPHSGAFLNARPCAPLGTRLDNTSLRIAVAIRLGAQVCLPHTCICGTKVDDSGRHGLCCLKSAGRMARHNHVNDIIKRALSSAEIPSRLEPISLSRHDDKRPDGMSLTPWTRGRCLAWDFTCPDTLAPSHLDVAVTGPGAVARAAEERKRQKYSELSHVFCFIPIAIETHGAFGDEALLFIQELGEKIKAVSGEYRATEFLFQRLSVAIQQGNAASVLGTLGEQSVSLEGVYYL